MDPVDRFGSLRAHMVAEQLAARGIRDARVLAAMGAVPRHRFVPAGEREQAYQDHPLSIPNGQTISQPYIVAYMLQALALSEDEKVLEIGTGSGYQAAILGELAREVNTIERHQELAEGAAHLLAELGYKEVYVHQGDGSRGWPESAPYDAIIVAAGAPVVPRPLLDQLSIAGRLIIPIGDASGQVLQLWKRTDAGFDYDELVPVAFVPLVGQHGWKE